MKYYIIIGMLLIVGILSAQTPQQRTITIDQAVQTGLENSKFLKSSQFKVIAAEAKSGETDALGLPSLKFNGSYTRLSEVPASAIPNFINPALPPIVLSPSVVNNYGLKATLQQPLFTGGKISGAIDANLYSSDAAKEDFKKDKADVIYNIKAAYWNLYRAIEFAKFVDDNVSQIRAHAVDADNLMKQGLLTTNDLLKVQVQLSDAMVRQIDAKNNIKILTYALNSTLGLPLTTEITLASKIEVNERDWDDVDKLTSKAIEQRPDMLAMDARLKASEAGLSAARGGWWPQIFLVGNYNYLRPNSRIFPTKDAFKDTWDVSLAVTFDIWNWNQTGNQTTQAQAQVSQAEQGLSMMKDGVMLDVTQNYLNVQQGKDRIAVAEQGVQQAEENYRVTDEKYKKGLTTNSELLDAETLLLQAKLNLTQSLVDFELAGARLSKSIGE